MLSFIFIIGASHGTANTYNINSLFLAYHYEMKAMNLHQKVSVLAERDFATLDENLTINEAAEVMRGKRITSILVIGRISSKPIGIVTERDVLYRVVAKNKTPSKIRLKNLVSSPLITIDEGSTMKEAVSLMLDKGIRRLPVMRGDNIIGILNAESVIGHMYEEKTDAGETNSSAMNIRVKDIILSCPYCQSMFKNKIEMSKHIDRIHLGSGLLEGDLRRW